MSVYLRQWHFLLAALKRRTGSSELAEDALQETWLRIAGMQKPEVPIRDGNAFVLRIAANIATDLIRKEGRHAAHCISDDEILRSIADTYPSAEAIVVDRDQLRQLALALAELPPKPRTALLLNRCDGRTHAQIARKLGVSESRVAQYLVQAVRHCRDHFRRIA
ncbi:RNA polymerase sigma factor [Hyphomicrobium sp. D-2]|uniref:RNA polymerase sigma factor n=1 Tax=Hyphomicrobium sp. D-2 TaxID=3041621 RepID=UPI002458679A|nr:RNA polymerase sigma factor [Hyphomicrobium sp. D-2]MDH4982604.1 RNA polymerase sigma factor [Hyphomicrobium sp. D-2]